MNWNPTAAGRKDVNDGKAARDLRNATARERELYNSARADELKKRGQ